MQQAVNSIRLAPGVVGIYVEVQVGRRHHPNGAQLAAIERAQAEREAVREAERAVEAVTMRRRERIEIERRARVCESDEEALRWLEDAEDLEELNAEFLGVRVQLTEEAREELRAVGWQVPMDGVVYVQRA